MNAAPRPRLELFDVSVRSVTMGEVAQSVAHLSNHILSSLSKTETSEVGTSGVFDGPLGFLNHTKFLRDLGAGRGGERRPAPPRLLARFLAPPQPESGSRIGADFKAEEVDKASNRGTHSESSTSGVSGQLSLGAVAEPGDGVLGDLFETFSEALHTNESSGGAVSKEDLGRATWTFLHTLAAQFPEQPTKQQQRDAKDLMSILSRIYPCKECADHFKEVLIVHPVETKSGYQLAQWICRAHNVVNRSLGKDQFPCRRVDMRWGALDCNEGVCDLHGRLFK